MRKALEAIKSAESKGQARRIATQALAGVDSHEHGAAGVAVFQPRYLICIDPGVKSGIALYDYDESRIKHVTTKDFWGVLDYVCGDFPVSSCAVLIESSASDRFMWSAKGRGVNAAVGTARSVGENNREASLLQQRLSSLGYRCALIPPLNTKMTADEVRLVSGWQGKTSEHSRDAVMMVMAHTNRQLLLAKFEWEDDGKSRV